MTVLMADEIRELLDRDSLTGQEITDIKETWESVVACFKTVQPLLAVLSNKETDDGS